MVLFLGVGVFAYWTHQQNLTTRKIFQIPVVEMPTEQRQVVVDALKKRLSDPQVMGAVCRDSGYTSTFGFASEDEAVKDLLSRLLCETVTKSGNGVSTPLITVGFKCKVKEFEKMDKVTLRLRDDIFKILGVPEGGGDGGAF